MTNGYYIKGMTNRELTDFFLQNVENICDFCIHEEGNVTKCNGRCKENIQKYFDSETNDFQKIQNKPLL